MSVTLVSMGKLHFRCYNSTKNALNTNNLLDLTILPECPPDVKAHNVEPEECRQKGEVDYER